MRELTAHNRRCVPVTDLNRPPLGTEGAYAAKRKDLAASRLARYALTRGEIPNDPATGEPFRTEKVEGGTRVWSPLADDLRKEENPWPEPELFDNGEAQPPRLPGAAAASGERPHGKALHGTEAASDRAPQAVTARGRDALPATR